MEQAANITVSPHNQFIHASFWSHRSSPKDVGRSRGRCVGVRAQLHRDQVCVTVREKAQRPEKQTKRKMLRREQVIAQPTAVYQWCNPRRQHFFKLESNQPQKLKQSNLVDKACLQEAIKPVVVYKASTYKSPEWELLNWINLRVLILFKQPIMAAPHHTSWDILIISQASTGNFIKL